MAFVRVGSRSQLPPGEVLEARIGEDYYAVCDVGGELHAVDGLCPHRGGRLAQGALHQRMLVCPWHAWEFDCTSGEYDYNPMLKLRKYEVRVQGDDILIDVPEPDGDGRRVPGDASQLEI